MDGAHLLSLKVMRASRPTIASAWEPFYSSSPSFSAHSTASILSLQGKAPLDRHPKTLRDLSHATELLTLPSSFGTIQLGETFSSCLCVNNEAGVPVEGVSLKVEMQTATVKTTLAEVPGGDDGESGNGGRLEVGDTMEQVVGHEIKELGQHVLACTVSYRLPPSTRQLPPGTESSNIATFRKFYKFAVTNPLTVRTKVHVPRAPSAVMSQSEREKVFLEVHIQNMTQDALWFEQMRFDCADGWQAEDVNTLGASDETDHSLYVGSAALMQPQDTRQYLYIISPASIPSFPVAPTPGAVIPLGRLDITWRSSFGEPGRLLTSMLSRRIPLPPAAPVPAQQPASAVPSYLQRQPVPVRPQSPQQTPSRPGTPPNAPTPQRPASPVPYRPRTASVSSIHHDTIHHPTPSTPVPPAALGLIPTPSVGALEVDLVVRDFSREDIHVDRPLKIPFTLTISGAPPPPGKHRIIGLVMQHVRPPRVAAVPVARPPQPGEPFSPRLPSSGFSTPTTVAPAAPTGISRTGNISNQSTGFGQALAEKLEVASPRRQLFDTAGGGYGGKPAVVLPPPFWDVKEVAAQGRAVKMARGASFLGMSAVRLPPFTLTVPDTTADDGGSLRTEAASGRIEARQEFELEWMPERSGLVTLGGLRALVVEDRVAEGGEEAQGEKADDREEARRTEARTMKEWDVVAEIWVM